MKLSVEKKPVTLAIFKGLVDAALAIGPHKQGIDTENNMKDQPQDRTVGVSVFFPHPSQAVSVYIPLRHELGEGNPHPLNEDPKGVMEELNRLSAAGHTHVFHSAASDIPRMCRDGYTPGNVRDSLILANMLQLMNTGLKAIALELGLVSFADSRTYIQTVVELLGLEGHIEEADEETVMKRYPWSLVDPFHPRAVEYACDDAIWTVVAHKMFENTYMTRSGMTKEQLDEILDWQNDTAVLLAKDVAKGYPVDVIGLEHAVEQQIRDHEIDKLEIMDMIRDINGWPRREMQLA